jgi:mRNA (guanine-N7-)-methyltransferase
MRVNNKFDIFIYFYLNKKYNYTIVMVKFNDSEIKFINTMHEIKRKYNDLEFEIIFGSLKNPISQSQFLYLLKDIKNKTLKKKLNYIESTTSLDINIHRSDIIDINDRFNLRFTINGSNNISTFCSNNELNNLNYDIVYKKDYIFTNNDNDIIPKIQDEFEKKHYQDGKKVKLDVPNFNIRYNLKNELQYSKKDKQFISSNITLLREANKEYKTFKDHLNRYNNKFSQLYKTFRLKNRYSFKTLDGNIRYDLTIIQSSKEELNINGNFIQKPVKEFIDALLLEQDKTYEVELELFQDKNEIDIYDTYKYEINETIDMVLIGLNNYPHIISKQEKEDIKYIYEQFLRVHFLKIIKNKLNVLENVKQYNREKNINIDKANEIKDNYTNLSYFNNIINSNKDLRNIATELYNIEESIIKNTFPYVKNGRLFQISPKPVSIELQNIQNNTNGSMITDTIYSVTDKADGLSKLLYIVGLEHFNDTFSDNINNPLKLTLEKLQKYNKYVGNIYLIDSNLVVYSTGLNVSNTKFHNTLINGEYINHDINNNVVNLFRAYDIYIDNFESTIHLPLISENEEDNTRIKILNNVISSIKPYMKYKKQNYVIKLRWINHDIDLQYKLMIIGAKHFEIGKGTELFKKSSKIWKEFTEGRSRYKYDGLIYTPIDYPVAYKQNINYDIETGNTWFMNIKWKPEYENTIDFLVKELKEEVSSYKISKIEKPKINVISSTNAGNKIYNRYKTYHLEVGKNEEEYIDNCREQLQNYIPKKKKKNSRYLSTNFIPTLPYDETAYISKIIINKQTNEVVGNEWNRTFYLGLLENNGDWENTNDIIRDNTIVEFSYKKYDINDPRYVRDKEFRWVPLRTREDKTYQYKLGVKKQKELYKLLNKFINISTEDPNKKLTIKEFNQLNSLKNIIKSVPNIQINNNNLDLNIISNYKSDIENYYPNYSFIKSPEIKIVYGNDYNTANNIWKTIHNPVTEAMITTGENIPQGIEIDENDKYYRNNVSQQREKSLTLTLQNFHNKVVKDKFLIKKVVEQLNKEGIDNIHLLDLACGKGGDIPKWIHNDISSVVGIDMVRDNIYNQIDGACVRRKNLLKKKNVDITFIVGDISKNINNGDSFNEPLSIDLWRELWKQSDKNTEYSKYGFNIISCMFAIHYVFNSEINLDNFIVNVDENLKNGGYFIGTCLDGRMVFDLFERQNIIFNGYIKGEKDSKNIWKLQKLYNQNTFLSDENSLNMVISVFMNSINQEIKEYLVNFDYLVKKLKDKNIVLLSPDIVNDMNLPLNNIGEYKSEGSFQNIFNNLETILKDKNNKMSSYNQKLYNDITLNISEAEKQLSFLTRYFIFKKQSINEIEVNKLFNKLKIRINTDPNYYKIISKKKIDWNSFKEKIDTDEGRIIDEPIWNELKEQLTRAKMNNEFKKKITIKKKKITIKKKKINL